MGTREARIEQYLKKQVKEIGGLCYKWVCPGHAGVPDRIVLYQQYVYFVEVKTKNGLLSDVQYRTREDFYMQQHTIHILSSKAEVDNFIRTVMLRLEHANTV